MKKRITLSILVVSLSVLLLSRHSAEAEPDAITAASLTVSVTGITPTSAVVQYSKDKYDYGTRTLCYGIAPAVPTGNCTTKTAVGNQGSFAVSNLKAATQYNFSIKAVDTKGGEKPYTTSSTFTTTAPTGLVRPFSLFRPMDPAAVKTDLRGRSLPQSAKAAQRTVTLPPR